MEGFLNFQVAPEVFDMQKLYGKVNRNQNWLNTYLLHLKNTAHASVTINI